MCGARWSDGHTPTLGKEPTQEGPRAASLLTLYTRDLGQSRTPSKPHFPHLQQRGPSCTEFLWVLGALVGAQWVHYRLKENQRALPSILQLVSEGAWT